MHLPASFGKNSNLPSPWCSARIRTDCADSADSARNSMNSARNGMDSARNGMDSARNGMDSTEFRGFRTEWHGFRAEWHGFRAEWHGFHGIPRIPRGMAWIPRYSMQNNTDSMWICIILCRICVIPHHSAWIAHGTICHLLA